MKTLAVGTTCLTLITFYFYRSPPVLYLGLGFVFLSLLEREKIKCSLKLERKRVFLASILMFLGVFALVHPLWKTSSPMTFLSLSIGALIIILCEKPQKLKIEILYLAVGPTLAIISRTNVFQMVESKMSNWFVGMTSNILAFIVKLSALPVSVNGNVITTRGMLVIIKPGCSGLGAFSLYILATIFLIYARKSSLKEAILLLAGALGIVPINALRIFILLLVGYHYGISMLELFHSHLGDVIFLLYVYLYWRLILRYSAGLKHPESK